MKISAIGSLLLMGGCVFMARQPGNHALWHARFSEQEKLEGMVIILDSPPKAEFAFLMAQRFPEAFVIWRPASDPMNPYLYNETYIDTMACRLQEGDIIFRKTGWFGRRTPTQVLLKQLGATLIFHQMKLAGCHELPPTLKLAPRTTFSWSQERGTLSQAKQSSIRQFFSRIGALPTLLTLGTIWPPPWPIRDAVTGGHVEYRQKLVLTFSSRDPIHLVQDDASEKGFVMGGLWFIPFALFGGDRSNSWSAWDVGSSYHSPGGWANCLEQAAAHPEIERLARSVNAETLISMNKDFDEVFVNGGFRLEHITANSPYRNENRFYLVPPNSLFNLYLNLIGDKLFIPFPGINFSKMNWPNMCLLAGSDDESRLRYVWARYESGSNWFAPALMSRDHVRGKSYTRGAFEHIRRDEGWN